MIFPACISEGKKCPQTWKCCHNIFYILIWANFFCERNLGPWTFGMRLNITLDRNHPLEYKTTPAVLVDELLADFLFL